MAALTVNGISLPVALGSWKQQVQGADWASTLARGVRLMGRTRKRRWAGALVPCSQEDAQAYRGLLAGLGHHFSFDVDLYSDSGLGPALASGATAASGPGSLVGQGKYLAVSGYTGQAEWAVGASTDWTVLATNYRAGHTRLLLRSDGALWRNGVRADTDPGRRPFSYTPATGRLRVQCYAYGGADWTASSARALGSWTLASGRAYECTTAGTTGATAPAWGSVQDGTTTDNGVVWTLRADTNGSAIVGDLAWLPYRVPDAWVAPLYAYLSANPFSSLPKLQVAGDLIASGPVAALGVDEEGEGLVGNVGTGLKNNLERLAFALQEL